MLADDDIKLLGGSDVAAVCGLSRYRAPIDVWRRVVEGNLPDDANEATERGALLEPVIREMYRRRTGATLLGPRKLRSGYLRANLDDETADKVCEFKSAAIHVAHLFGEEGTDEVPTEYLLQVQHYLSMTGKQTADLAAFIGGAELRIFRIDADAELQAMSKEACERFWTDCVLTQQPPKPDSTESYAEWLAAKYPRHNDTTVKADDDAERWAAVYLEADEAEKAAAERKENAKNWLRAAIGPADGIVGNGWRISYKQSKGRAVTAWEYVCDEAKVDQLLIEKHTTRKPFRTFRATWAKQEKR